MAFEIDVEAIQLKAREIQEIAQTINADNIDQPVNDITDCASAIIALTQGRTGPRTDPHGKAHKS